MLAGLLHNCNPAYTIMVCNHAYMSTLKERITEVMNSQGWDTPQQVANVAGVSRSAAAQWLGQGSKIINSIGNIEAAEKLARHTGYNAYWIAKGEGPKMAAKPGVLPVWPFPGIDEEKIRALSEREIAQLEGVILMGATQLGFDIKKTQG